MPISYKMHGRSKNTKFEIGQIISCSNFCMSKVEGKKGGQFSLEVAAQLASSHNVRKRAKGRRRQHCNTWEGTWIEPRRRSCCCASHHPAARRRTRRRPQPAGSPQSSSSPRSWPRQAAPADSCGTPLCNFSSRQHVWRALAAGRASSIRQVAFLVAVSSTTMVCSLQRSFSTCTTRRSDLLYSVTLA